MALDNVYGLMVLRRAEGDMYFKSTPLPLDMKSICRPQVALILDMNSEIVRFFLCELTGGGSCVKGLDFETLPNDALWKYGIMAMTTDTTATKKKYGVE